MKRAEMAKNPKKSDGIVHLIEMDIDLKTNKVTLMYGPPNLELSLQKHEMNDRTRGKGQRKGDGAAFHYKDKFNNDLNKFGYAWHEKNKKKNPSLNQIVKGLQAHYVNNVVLAASRGMGKDKVKKMTKQYDNAFSEIVKSIGEKKPNQALAASYGKAENDRSIPIKDGLFDPENKATQTILWLYSMEPSFYADMARAARDMNMLNLDNLGPLAYAMHWIVKLAEGNKPMKLTLGSKLHKPESELTHELGSWCCADLVFRGAQMKPEWIEEWKSSVGLKGLKN